GGRDRPPNDQGLPRGVARRRASRWNHGGSPNVPASRAENIWPVLRLRLMWPALEYPASLYHCHAAAASRSRSGTDSANAARNVAREPTVIALLDSRLCMMRA